MIESVVSGGAAPAWVGRPADVEDAATLSTIHLRCVASAFARHIDAGSVVPPDPADDLAQMEGWLHPESGLDAWVAAAGDEVAGYVVIHEHRIVHLFVDPEHQGLGIGGELLRHAEQVLMERGVRELELHTRVENHAAVSFYAAAGWRVVDRITTVEHGTEYDEHVLTKRAQHTSILARSAWSAVGLLAVAIGAVGVFVPGLPTTVFFIIAAAAFSRSSRRMEAWVLSLPRVGPLVRDHRAGLGMPRRAKRLASVMIIAMVTLSSIFIDGWWIRGTVLAVGLIGVLYVNFRVPTRERVLAERS